MKWPSLMVKKGKTSVSEDKKFGWLGSRFSGNKSNYRIHFQLAAVMSVISGLAVSKLIWPERRKSESGPEKHETLTRVSMSCDKPEYVPVNGLDFALK